MNNFLYKIYAIIFSKPFFYKWNYHLYRCALSGMGILNYYDHKLNGEKHFIKKILPNYISSLPVVLDAGANVGNYTKSLLQVFPKASIHLFEPHPLNYQRLMGDNLLSHVTINNTALSDKPGTTVLFDYKNNDGSSHASLYKEVIESIHQSESTVHKIDKETIDHYLEIMEISNVDLLKIDVEGHELAVLQGSLNTISAAKINIIHFEFNEMNVESGTFMKDFYTILKDYNIYRMLPNSLLPISNYRPLTHEVFAYQNIVAIHKCINEKNNTHL